MRRWGRRSFVYMQEMLSLSLGLAVVVLWALMGLGQGQSQEYAFLRRAAENWLALAFDMDKADILGLRISWSAPDNLVYIDLEQAAFYDISGARLEYVDQLVLALSVPELLHQEQAVRSLQVRGGHLGVVREENGDIHIGVGENPGLLPLGQILSAQASPLSNTTASLRLPENLVSIDFSDVTAHVSDMQLGWQVRLDNLYMNYTRQADLFEGHISTALVRPDIPTQSPAQLDVNINGYTDLAIMRLDLEAKNFNPHQILPDMAELVLWRAVDMNLSTQLSIRRSSDIYEANWKMQTTEGQLIWNGQSEVIENIELTGSYARDREDRDGMASKMQIDSFRWHSQRCDFFMQGWIELGGGGQRALLQGAQTPFGFHAEFDRVELNGQPVFEDILHIDKLIMSGRVTPDFQALWMDEITMNFGDYEAILSMDLAVNKFFRPERFKLMAEITGDFTSRDLLTLWPVSFADGARRWVDAAMDAGYLRNFKADMRMDKQDFDRGQLKNENLQLSFDLEDGIVRYMPTMPRLEGASGAGVLQGNRFDMTVHAGMVEGLSVSGSSVNIPVLWPYGGNFTINIHGQGEVENMLRLINYKPFSLADIYSIDPSAFEGEGQINMSITRPLLVYFDPQRIRYAARGVFTDIRLPFTLGRFALHDGALELDLDTKSMGLQGNVRFGNWQANMVWRETFDPAVPTQYSLSGRLGRDDFDAFGIGLREFFDGEVDLKLKAKGHGLNITEASIHTDLRESVLTMGQIWHKPKGVAAILEGHFNRDDKANIVFDDFVAYAPGLAVTGELILASDYRLERLAFERAEIEGLISGQLFAQLNDEKTAFNIDITGRFFDVSGLIARALSAVAGLQTSNQAGSSAGFPDINIPFVLKADADELVLNESYSLSQAKIHVASNSQGLQNSHIEGQTPAGPLRLDLYADEASDMNFFTANIPDASRVLESFFNVDNIEGGHLQMEARLPSAGETGIVRGEVKIDKFILVRAPTFARILSLASFDGMTAALNGRGLSFNHFEVPFAWSKGNLSVRKAFASGPSLGITAQGEINFIKNHMDMDGIIVPAYGINNLLGGVSVVGDLLGGGQVGGIFGINYQARGTFDKTQLSVNPASVLTPGFLRGIFQPVRDALPEMETSKPPTE